MADQDFFAHHLRTRPVIAIFRGAGPQRTVELCRRAWAEHVQLVEVPVQTPEAMSSLTAALDAAAEEGRLVGAGTVTTADQLHAVHAAGVRFIVTPGLHEDVVAEALRLGLPCLPGVATATEIARAQTYGLNWLKAFPAAQLTPAWVTAQLGPFPTVRFVATGGIHAGNARDFLNAGCAAVAVGSAFTDPAEMRKLNTALEGLS